MKNKERRKERTPATIEHLRERYADVIDLTPFEERGYALELKGALVSDWVSGKIYCSLSGRAHEEVFNYLITKLNTIALKQGSKKRIRGVTFHSKDKNGAEIYHTDCMFTLLSKHAVVCLDAVTDPNERADLIDELTNPDKCAHPHKILSISF